MKRKMIVVGPVVAADSEQTLRLLRTNGALGAASAGLSDLSRAAPGGPRVAVLSLPASLREARRGHDAIARAHKPLASRHRQGPPGPA